MAVVYPAGNNITVKIRAAGTIAAGAFLKLTTNGVIEVAADTDAVIGVAQEAAVAGDHIALYLIDGLFNVSTVGDLAVGASVEWAAGHVVQAQGGVGSRVVGIVVGEDPASGARAVIQGLMPATTAFFVNT